MTAGLGDVRRDALHQARRGDDLHGHGRLDGVDSADRRVPPGKRYALPNAKIVIHQPWVSQIGGQATDVEIAARDLIATRQTVARIYEETTKKPIDQILKDIERDYYMTAQEAKDYGIIDQIIENRQRPAVTGLRRGG